MNTIQPALEPSSSVFSEWLQDAVDLVQRVNARLKSRQPDAALPAGRLVLTDERCVELAALAGPDRV